ncbi:MAG: hypothetical protein DDT31_00020 [Syntrophomonadaceae bacterium]|nr:hypothetical protein [Bacillota bacterium]
MSSGAVVRIGDKVSCGDNAAQGSANVFAGGMPITHEGKKTTTGHGCFPLTIFIGPYSKTVFVNNQGVVLKGQTRIQAHRCGRAMHDGVASTGASTVFIEG